MRTVAEVIAYLRSAGAQLSKYQVHLIAPEAGGIKALMAAQPAIDYLTLIAAAGNDNEQILTAIARNTEIDGRSYDVSWYRPQPTETLSAWKSRISLFSLDELDTTPRREAATGLMETVGAELSRRLYALVGYDTRTYSFSPTP